MSELVEKIQTGIARCGPSCDNENYAVVTLTLKEATEVLQLKADLAQAQRRVERERELHDLAWPTQKKLEQQVTETRAALQQIVKEMTGWPVTQVHSQTGVDVPMVMLNPAKLQDWRDRIAALGGHRSEPIHPRQPDRPELIRTDLARLLDTLYGLHFRPGHLDAVMDVVNLHAPTKVSLDAALGGQP